MSDKILEFITDYMQAHSLSHDMDDIRYIHFGYINEQSEADLNQLRARKKSAGFVAKEWFEIQNLKLPKVGLTLVFADYHGMPKAVGKVTHIKMVAYQDMTENIANDIAIGDGSLAQWRAKRTGSLIESCNDAGIVFSKHTELLVYWFELLLSPQDQAV